MKGFEEQLAIK